MRRTSRARLTGLVLLLALLPVAPLHAQDGDDAPENIFLLLPNGAQGVAMGRAATALPGAEAVFWNPAGLAELTGGRVMLYHGENDAGEVTAASGLFAQAGIGAVGITYHLLDAGEQESTDVKNNVIGTLSARNHLGIVSVATRFGNRVNVGFNFKVMQFRQSCRGQCLDAGVAATTYAVDGGAQLSGVGGLPLRIGAMIAHAGPHYQFRNEAQADPLPTRLRVAAAYEVLSLLLPEEELSLILTGEIEDRWRDLGNPAVYLGGEFSAGVEQATLLVRAGHVIGNGVQVDGSAVGVGIRYTRFDVGVAKSLAAGLVQESEPMHVTFGFIF